MICLATFRKICMVVQGVTGRGPSSLGSGMQRTASEKKHLHWCPYPAYFSHKHTILVLIFWTHAAQEQHKHTNAKEFLDQ